MTRSFLPKRSDAVAPDAGAPDDVALDADDGPAASDDARHVRPRAAAPGADAPPEPQAVIEATSPATGDSAPTQDDDDRSLMPLLLGGLGVGVLGAGAAAGGGGSGGLGVIGDGGGTMRPSLDGSPAGAAGDPWTSPSGSGGAGSGHRPAEAVLGLQVFAAGSAPDGTPLTRDGTVRVHGLEAGARWSYSFDGGTTWHPGESDRIPGTEAAKAGGDGRKTVLVYQTDVAGNDGPRAELVFDLDQTRPAAPAPRLKHDTGTSATDLWTSDPTVEIRGLEAGATLRVSLQGAPAFDLQGTEIPASRFAGLEGVCTVVVSQVDGAGNVSPSRTLEFWLDTTPPLAPQLVLASAPETGAVLPG